MLIPKRKWKLMSQGDGNAFMIRATKAEEHLKQALDLLHAIKEAIPQTPASETKQAIKNFIEDFQHT